MFQSRGRRYAKCHIDARISGFPLVCGFCDARCLPVDWDAAVPSSHTANITCLLMGGAVCEACTNKMSRTCRLLKSAGNSTRVRAVIPLMLTVHSFATHISRVWGRLIGRDFMFSHFCELTARQVARPFCSLLPQFYQSSSSCALRAVAQKILWTAHNSACGGVTHINQNVVLTESVCRCVFREGFIQGLPGVCQGLEHPPSPSKRCGVRCVFLHLIIVFQCVFSL